MAISVVAATAIIINAAFNCQAGFCFNGAGVTALLAVVTSAGLFCLVKARQFSKPAKRAIVSSVVVLGKWLYSTRPHNRLRVLALNETLVRSKISRFRFSKSLVCQASALPQSSCCSIMFNNCFIAEVSMIVAREFFKIQY